MCSYLLSFFPLFISSFSLYHFGREVSLKFVEGRWWYFETSSWNSIDDKYIIHPQQEATEEHRQETASVGCEPASAAPCAEEGHRGDSRGIPSTGLPSHRGRAASVIWDLTPRSLDISELQPTGRTIERTSIPSCDPARLHSESVSVDRCLPVPSFGKIENVRQILRSNNKDAHMATLGRSPAGQRGSGPGIVEEADRMGTHPSPFTAFCLSLFAPHWCVLLAAKAAIMRRWQVVPHSILTLRST